MTRSNQSKTKPLEDDMSEEEEVQTTSTTKNPLDKAITEKISEIKDNKSNEQSSDEEDKTELSISDQESSVETQQVTTGPAQSTPNEKRRKNIYRGQKEISSKKLAQEIRYSEIENSYAGALILENTYACALISISMFPMLKPKTSKYNSN